MCQEGPGADNKRGLTAPLKACVAGEIGKVDPPARSIGQKGRRAPNRWLQAEMRTWVDAGHPWTGSQGVTGLSMELLLANIFGRSGVAATATHCPSVANAIESR